MRLLVGCSAGGLPASPVRVAEASPRGGHFEYCERGTRHDAARWMPALRPRPPHWTHDASSRSARAAWTPCTRGCRRGSVTSIAAVFIISSAFIPFPGDRVPAGRPVRRLRSGRGSRGHPAAPPPVADPGAGGLRRALRARRLHRNAVAGDRARDRDRDVRRGQPVGSSHDAITACRHHRRHRPDQCARVARQRASTRASSPSPITVAFAAAAGDGTRSRREYIAAITERAERAEETRESEARTARVRGAAAHRARSARCGRPSDRGDQPERRRGVIGDRVAAGGSAARPSRTIRGAARTVLGEIGALLEVLRTEDDAGDRALSPQPGLERLDELVGQFADGGLAVTVRTEGDPSPVAGRRASSHTA